MIAVGDKEVKRILRGDKDIVRVYKGDEKLYDGLIIKGTTRQANQTFTIKVAGESVSITSDKNSKFFYKTQNYSPITEKEMFQLLQDRLRTLTLSGWELAKLTDCSNMFQGIYVQELNINSLNTSECETFNFMFSSFAQYETSPRTIDLRGLDLGKAKDLSNMFGMNWYLEAVYLGAIPSVTNMNYIFYMNFSSVGTMGLYMEEFGTQENMQGTSQMFYMYKNLTITKESVLYSFRDHSFDRVAAGYAALTIDLPQSSIDLLSDEEKAAITAKGYTIIASIPE